MPPSRALFPPGCTLFLLHWDTLNDKTYLLWLFFMKAKKKSKLMSQNVWASAAMLSALTKKSCILIILTVFHRSIAMATNYFVLQVPEATIRGRRLFEGSVNKRIVIQFHLLLSPLPYSPFIHTKLSVQHSLQL